MSDYKARTANQNPITETEVPLRQKGEASVTRWYDRSISILVGRVVEHEGASGVEFKNRDDALAFCKALAEAVRMMPED